MHHFIYANKDSWISSGSSHVDGTSFRDQNFGKDEILEIKKEYYNRSFDYATRALVYFSDTDITNISKSIDGGGEMDIKPNARYYLRMYEANGTQELSLDYTLVAHPLSQSWIEGTGKFTDDPKTKNGVSWENRQFEVGATEVTWSNQTSSFVGGGNFMSGSGFSVSQSFSNASPDIEMDVTDIVNGWLSGSSNIPRETGSAAPANVTGSLANHGFIIKFSGSQEDASNADDSITYGKLKFFSSDTNTIYTPKLEIRWDDHLPCTGSNTGSLNQLTMSGDVDNFLYMKGIKESYRENEIVRFRVGARKRYIQKTFSGSLSNMTASFIPEGSGSYSIRDLATGETVVPFSSYTSMSCDSENGNYFIQRMNGFYPNREYGISLKLRYDDGQEEIFDEDFKFRVRT